MNSRNIMEDITRKYLDEMLSMRFDICTCETCKQAIIAFALTRISPKYVLNDSEYLEKIIKQVRTEHSTLILKELGTAIRTITANPRHQESQDREHAYHLLMKQIKDDRGVDFSHYRDRVLKRRIALRMRAKKVRTYPEYLQVLTHNPEEYEVLFEVLTINVSSFFRCTCWSLGRVISTASARIFIPKSSRSISTLRITSRKARCCCLFPSKRLIFSG